MLFAAPHSAQVFAQQVAPPPPDHVVTLPSKLTLVDLVELAASARSLNVEYDPSKLRGDLTLRVREAVSPAELWEITVSLLESRALVVIETDVEGLWRVVDEQNAHKQDQVPGIAAPGQVLGGDVASYVSALVQLRSDDAALVKKAIEPLLSAADRAKPIGDRLPGGGSLLLITDVKRRVERALELIDLFDRPSEPVESAVVMLRHLSADGLDETLEQITAAETAAGAGQPGPLTGVQTVPFGSADDGRSRVLVLAPASKQAMVRSLIDELDVAPATVTRTYTATGLSADDLAQAITAVLGLGAQKREGLATSVVAERWTGAVLVRATPPEHNLVQDLITRIEQAPPGIRRELRSFTILNRDATDLQSVLQELLLQGIEGGVVPIGAAAPAESGAERRPQAFSRTSDQLERLALTADESTNTLIAVGEPSLIRQLEQLVEQLDRRDPQVMIEVMLVSLSEGEAFDLGVELRTEFEEGQTSVNLASLFGLGSGAGGLADGTGFTGSVIRPGDYELLIRALETFNDGNSISRPVILANNNEAGTITSVQQVPFASINASDTVATTSFGGTEDAGTTLTVEPQIAEGDHLVLRYTVELSAFTGESTTTADGAVIPPPSQSNTLDGAVTIPDGFTVMLGGLETTTQGDSRSQVPVLGSLPIIGHLFGTTSTSETRSRFYVFIKATVLRDALFDDLKQLSGRPLREVGEDDGHPRIEPVWMD